MSTRCQGTWIQVRVYRYAIQVRDTGTLYMYAIRVRDTCMYVQVGPKVHTKLETKSTHKIGDQKYTQFWRQKVHTDLETKVRNYLRPVNTRRGRVSTSTGGRNNCYHGKSTTGTCTYSYKHQTLLLETTSLGRYYLAEIMQLREVHF